MITLDLTIGPMSPFYKGCQFADQKKPGKYYLATPMDSGSVLVASNVQDWIRTIPDPRSQSVELTGQAPAWVYVVVTAIVTHIFKEVSYYNGNDRVDVHSKLVEVPEDHPHQ